MLLSLACTYQRTALYINNVVIFKKISCAAAENNFAAAALTANATPVETLIRRTNEAGALQERPLAAALVAAALVVEARLLLVV